ncbi:MAG: helix-turn-helix transcriptional regulator [Solirubrobacteraceae bacterium]
MRAPNPAANLPWRADAALLAMQLGDNGTARRLIDENLQLATAFGAPHAIAVALRTAGLIEGGDRGLGRLDAAVAVLEGSEFHLHLARSLVEQGAAMRRAGRRRDAQQTLRRGLDLAADCGALGLSRRAREELVAAGAKPRRERIWGPDALTASELRVARMAADGMSNPQIAQALFISRKTVSVHLTHAYQKLGIDARAPSSPNPSPRADRHVPPAHAGMAFVHVRDPRHTIANFAVLSIFTSGGGSTYQRLRISRSTYATMIPRPILTTALANAWAAMK